MKYCQKCVMPDTKPGVVLDEEGVCQACRNYEKRKSINWQEKFEQLKELANKYRRDDGYYDCIVTSSGGKDSHFAAYIMKRLLNMNPLVVSVVDPFTKTKAGMHNFQNILDAFGCDNISLHMNPDLVRKIVRIALEELGSPTWPVDRAIYAFPIQMAIKMNIKLVTYGENVSYEYGGVQQEETYSAKDQIYNDVAKNIGFKFWYERGIKKEEINSLIYPAAGEIEEAQIEPIYLSYFISWDGFENYQLAKKYGFRDLAHEWKREGYIEDYDQIDTMAYLVHPWLKYPKFGFTHTTDVCCYWIRGGKITREEAIELVRQHDHKLDQRALDDFLQFTGYTDEEFWEIVLGVF